MQSQQTGLPFSFFLFSLNLSSFFFLISQHHYSKFVCCFQVDPLFTVPAPPPPISSSITPQILPSYFSPSSSNIAAPVEQLLVRTRSVGVNTCEVGVVTEPECLGPCEPGTSVNLEGIVWHETEEGKLFFPLGLSVRYINEEDALLCLPRC